LRRKLKFGLGINAPSRIIPEEIMGMLMIKSEAVPFSCGGLKILRRQNVFDEHILKTELRNNNYRIPADLRGKTVIDIGAHIGGTTLRCAKMGAVVYAFEPQPDNLDILKQNIKLNGFESSVHCYPHAIGYPAGIRKLFLHPSNYGAFSFNNQNTDLMSSEYNEVEVITLEECFKKFNIASCEFLKMDCERAEYDIILNTPAEIFAKIKWMTIELHQGDHKKVIAVLNKYYVLRFDKKPDNDNTRNLVYCNLKR
jgi:FkbM family methyltransferase